MRVVILLLALAACGGQYAAGNGSTLRMGNDRGETNGRMFDFVSDKPEGDDWQIRVRGTSMWVSYSHDAKSDELGTKNLTQDESDKLWELVDALDLQNRKAGKKDEDNGTVTLRVREPGDERHDIYTVYVSRETEDDGVLELGQYLRKLVGKHFKETPNF